MRQGAHTHTEEQNRRDGRQARSSSPPPPEQGYALRSRLQELRRADPGAALPEADWQRWLGIGNSLRDMGEVLPLDAQDWYAVS